MIKSIIKRVIVGVSIALILGLIGSCEVKALSYATPYKFADQRVTQISNYYSVNHFVQYQYHWYVSATNVVLPKFAVAYDTSDTTVFDRDKLYDVSIVINTRGLAFQPVVEFNNASCNVYNNEYNDTSTNNTTLGSYAYVYCNNVSFTDNISYLNIWFQVKDTAAGDYYIPVGRLYYGVSSLSTQMELLQQQAQTLTSIDSSVQAQTTQQHQDAQQTQQKLDEINNTMKDDNTSDIETNAISNAKNNVASNNVISDLVLLPVNLFTKILNSTSASCSPFSLGSLYGEELILPCIVLSDYLGSSLVSVIDVLISGLFIYAISRKMVKIFEELSSLRTGGNDV